MANIERLQKLADHLLNGKLGHVKFDFGVYNSDFTESNPCGTAGCAIGECPIVWPDEWHFDKYYGDPVISTKLSPRVSGLIFFGLTNVEYSGLFTPYAQHHIGLPYLNRYATAKKVADNILLFIQKIKDNAEY